MWWRPCDQTSRGSIKTYIKIRIYFRHLAFDLFFGFSFWKLFSCLNGPTENIFEGFLAIRMEVNENIFEGFSAVRMEVNENIFQGFSMTNEKTLRKTKCVSNDRSRHDDSNGYRIIKFGAILGG